MSAIPVLPYHTQDAVLALPALARTGSHRACQIPLSPRPSLPVHTVAPIHPTLSHNQATGASASCTRTSPLKTLDAVILELAEEGNVFDEEAARQQSDEGHGGNTSTSAPSHKPFRPKMDDVRVHMRRILHHERFHYAVIGLVILDLVAVFVDITISLLDLPCSADAAGVANSSLTAASILYESTALIGGEFFLWSVSVFLLCIFTLELVACLFAFGPRHFSEPMYAIDGVVVFTSLVLEIYFKFGDQGKAGQAPAALIVLRLWKVVRAIHAMGYSIGMKTQSIIQEIRRAMSEVEEEHRATSTQLARDRAKLDYFRERLPGVQDEELEQYADVKLEQQRLMLEIALLKEDTSDDEKSLDENNMDMGDKIDNIEGRG